MGDVEVLIKIPENTYRRIQVLARNDYFEHDICGYSMQRIANGTPLPKGHGNLIDRDNLEYEIASIEGYSELDYECIAREDIEQEPIIVGADN